MRILCNERTRYYVSGTVQTGVCVYWYELYELSINRDYNRRQVMHSEMFLKVCLGFTTVPAETAFVLVFFMAQLVIAKIRRMFLMDLLLLVATILFSRVLAEGDCKQ